MENITSQLMRTCSVCGIEKPLSAFLQLDSTHGTSYGKVCAKCRSEGKTNKPAPTNTEDERSTAPSGIGIRGKEKIYADTKREQKIHSLKELYKKENIKKQDMLEDKLERKQLKEDAEKKHREFYIDRKKEQPSADKKTQANQQVTERQQTDKIKNIQKNATETLQTIFENKAKQTIEITKAIEKEEIKKTSTDFNNLFHALEPGKIEMQGEITRFFTWLGNSAPIVKKLKAGMEKKELTTEGKNPNEPTRRNR